MPEKIIIHMNILIITVFCFYIKMLTIQLKVYNSLLYTYKLRRRISLNKYRKLFNIQQDVKGQVGKEL